MYKIFLVILISFQSQAFATIDSNTNVFIPVKHVQSGEFFVQLAPLVGCYGLPRGPQLLQLTKPYVVNNLGCGMETKENINALKCAKVVKAVEADDYSTFKKITLDISKCEDKNDHDFINIVRKVVRLNFATRTKPNPQLILIKKDIKIISEDLF